LEVRQAMRVEVPSTKQIDTDMQHSSAQHQHMHIAIFTNSVSIGGMEKHAEMLARDLDRSRATVYTICPKWEPVEAWAKDFAAASDGTARITPDRRYGLLAELRETVRLYRQLRQWHIDVLHMHLTTYYGGQWALLAARLARVPVIVCTEHLAPERPLSRPRKLQRDLVTRMYNRVICVSEKNRIAREQHLYTPPAHTSVVVNGIDVSRFTPTPPEEMARLREQYGIPADARVAGTVVRFVDEKGLNYLFDAMPRVLESVPNAYLLMVGDGPLRGDLERQATELGFRDRVIFAGFQSDPRPFMSLMHAFVLPVPFGSASIGLLEAMAMGRAVIITFGGKGEAVIDGETGLCPPPRDPAALAEAMTKVLVSPEYERQLGTNARKRIEADFSAQRVAEQLLAIYEADYAASQRSRHG